MDMIPQFDPGEKHSDPGFAGKLRSIVSKLNSMLGLTGDQFIGVQKGPRGKTIHLNLEILRRRIGRGVTLFGKAQQEGSPAATGVAWVSSAIGIGTTTLKTCDEDGSNQRGDAFTAYIYHSSARAPNVRVDQVVPYTLSESGRLVTQGDFADDPIGTIKQWRRELDGTPLGVPAGWVVCDGNDDTINLDGTIIIAHDTTESSPGAIYDDVGKAGTIDIISASYDDPHDIQVLGFIQRIN